jgi:hypothetical protein
LAAFAQVFGEIPCARLNEGLFVIAEAMKEIENVEPAGFIGVEGWRENNAVVNRTSENFARNGIALDAAGGCAARQRDGQEQKG